MIHGAAHAVVASLYKATAEALLASTPTLEFTKLEWTAADFAQLGAALRLTRARETLSLHWMPLDDEGARALVPALPRTLKTLKLTLGRLAGDFCGARFDDESEQMVVTARPA